MGPRAAPAAPRRGRERLVRRAHAGRQRLRLRSAQLPRAVVLLLAVGEPRAVRLRPVAAAVAWRAARRRAVLHSAARTAAAGLGACAGRVCAAGVLADAHLLRALRDPRDAPGRAGTAGCSLRSAVGRPQSRRLAGGGGSGAGRDDRHQGDDDLVPRGERAVADRRDRGRLVAGAATGRARPRVAVVGGDPAHRRGGAGGDAGHPRRRVHRRVPGPRRDRSAARTIDRGLRAVAAHRHRPRRPRQGRLLLPAPRRALRAGAAGAGGDRARHRLARALGARPRHRRRRAARGVLGDRLQDAVAADELAGAPGAAGESRRGGRGTRARARAGAAVRAPHRAGAGLHAGAGDRVAHRVRPSRRRARAARVRPHRRRLQPLVPADRRGRAAGRRAAAHDRCRARRAVAAGVVADAVPAHELGRERHRGRADRVARSRRRRRAATARGVPAPRRRW